ncbi:MFS transporter [Streptomyces sp. 4N509B]|uniref:MFS transporter n=1 Tax=Streptomyces sp. 4N509B TaxID=3457413 RepID=UPI003FD06426
MSDIGRSPLGGSFWRLWTSAGLSNLADGVLKVAVPLVAIDLTRSPTLIAGVAMAMTLPWLLFALPAGALADRLDRRRAMIGANVLRGALVAALALLHALAPDAGSIWLLYAVAFGVGVAETLYDTSAQSILPQMVPRESLTRANGRLFAVELTANQFVGPPLGGFLVVAGTAVALATPAGLWVLAVAALLLVRGSFRVERTGPRTTLRADIAEGLRFLWHHRLLRTLAAMVGVFNFASNATMAVLVLYAVGPESTMGLSEQAYGLLLTTTAVGSLVGSFVAEHVERRLGRAVSVALTIPTSALAVGLPALTANPYLIGGAYLLWGVGIVVWNVVTVSLRQRVTPDRLLGRLNSCYRLFAWGTMPLGALAGGLLAEFLGIRAVFVIMAGLTLALFVGMTVVTNAAIDAAERAAEGATERADAGAGAGNAEEAAEDAAQSAAPAEPPVRAEGGTVLDGRGDDAGVEAGVEAGGARTDEAGDPPGAVTSRPGS